MDRLQPLLLTLALLAAPASGGDPPTRARGAVERGDVVGFEIPDRPGARHEFFELRHRGSVVGVGAVHLGADERSMRSELRLDLFPIDTRVVHVERTTPAGPRLVWREIRLRSGRTVVAEWGDPASVFASVDWSATEFTRREEEPEVGALLPLYLVGRAREGQFLRGRFDVFDPVSNRVEEWAASVRRVALLPVGTGLSRVLTLTRSDGTLAGEYLFSGGELIAFRLQSGGPTAVRTTRAAYDEGRTRRRATSRDARPSPASTSLGAD